MRHAELLPVPHIDTLTDPVHSAADLRQRWRALMGPLGFGEPLLWLGFVGPDRRMMKAWTQLPIDARPRRRMLKNFMTALRRMLDDLAPGITVAFLLTGPGRGQITRSDQEWAESLSDMAERLAVPLEPIFRANDETVQLIQPEGLAETCASTQMLPKRLDP